MRTEIRVPGLVCVEHTVEVPLDHVHPERATIELFAREVADPDGSDRPFLVFFQGGPGFEAVRPTGQPRSPGWLDHALGDYRVLLLDQRGTGRSAPVGLLSGMTALEQVEYLTHFRADSIVRDAELVRRALEVERWSVLGQSFGGFCALTYLSLAPEGLREAFLTGGLPPLFLYDSAVLAVNEVPRAAAVYTEDMYVERDFSEESAARIPGMRAWITSEYDHKRPMGQRAARTGPLVRPGPRTSRAREREGPSAR